MGRAKAGDRVVRERSGLVGQIINEDLLSPAASESARLAIKSGSIQEAAEAIRSHGCTLSTARALLVTLKRAGMLQVREASQAPNTVPTFLWQAWLGSPLPEDAALLVSDWKKLNPGWQHVLFSSDSALDWLRDHCGKRAVKAFRAANHPAAQADLLRLALLSVSGGVWSDIDDRALRPIDQLVSGRSIVARLDPYGSIGNNFLAFSPGHSVALGALEEAVESCLSGYREATWLTTGPGLIAREMCRWLSDNLEKANLGTDTVLLEPHQLASFVAIRQPLRYKGGPLAWQRAGPTPTTHSWDISR